MEIVFEARESYSLSLKRAIAQTAFETLRPHESVFMDSGTSVLQMARRLRLDPMPLNVFTDSIAIVQALLDTPHMEISLIVGRIRNAAMIRQATQRYLLVDSSKFGRHATFRVGPLKDMSHIITDDGLPPEWEERFTQASISFRCVPSESNGT